MNITKVFLIALITVINLQVAAQADEKSEIFIELQKGDSLLFEEGFNKCNFSALEKIMVADFEFYHDQSFRVILC